MRLLAGFITFLITFGASYTTWSGSYTYNVTIKNHQFEPAELLVPTDKRIKLTIHNLDSTAEEFESDDLRREKIIAGNSSTVVSFGPLSAGTYNFFGEFHPDTAQGKVVAQ